MQPMSKGTNNYLQINSNIKHAIKIGFLIDHKASLQIKWQATLAQSNVASLESKQPRENAQKGSADYSALLQKARWFETR